MTLPQVPKYKVIICDTNGKEVHATYWTDEKLEDIERVMEHKLCTWDSPEEYAADHEEEHPL